MNPSEEKCHICGEQATQFLFAQYVCDNEDCINKVRDERGGPGGHMLERSRHETSLFGAPDFDEELD